MSEVPTHVNVQFCPTTEVQSMNAMGKHYTYLNHEPEIEVGDVVVVQLGSTLRFVRVTSVTPTPAEQAKATKWIVQRIDMAKHNALTAMSPPTEVFAGIPKMTKADDWNT